MLQLLKCPGYTIVVTEVTLSMVPVGVERNGRFERAKGPSIISLVMVVFISMSFSFAQERRFDKKSEFQSWRVLVIIL